MSSSHVVIILGMHRSGTSSLAGSLQSAGLFLGEVNTQAPYNAKGNRESLQIMALHDRVLANDGHAWHTPPPGAASWGEDDRAQRDAIIHQLEVEPVWGFKDPRTLLTLEGWLERVPNARLVGTLRHPARVAASLAARPEPLYVEPAHGLALWRRYNRRLLALWRQSPFPILDFDGDPAEYRRALDAACRDLGLAGCPDFFDEALRRSAPALDLLDDETAALYAELRRACRASAALAPVTGPPTVSAPT